VRPRGARLTIILVPENTSSDLPIRPPVRSRCDRAVRAGMTDAIVLDEGRPISCRL